MKPAGTPLEVFFRLLEEGAAALATGDGLQIPEDELHREILVPLLPAMLGDKAIRQHWREQTATGFLARLAAHLESDAHAHAPHWLPGDFEIHVTASYLAGPDAKALADTLLSEESLRDLTAALMNQTLAVVWPKLPAAEILPEPVAPPPIIPVPEPVPEPITPEAAAKALPQPATTIPSVTPVPSAIEQPAAATREPAPAPAGSPDVAESETTSITPIPLPSVVEPALPGPLLRPSKPNPLRGIHHTFGGLADHGWLYRNPLKRRRLG